MGGDVDSVCLMSVMLCITDPSRERCAAAPVSAIAHRFAVAG